MQNFFTDFDGAIILPPTNGVNTVYFKGIQFWRRIVRADSTYHTLLTQAIRAYLSLGKPNINRLSIYQGFCISSSGPWWAAAGGRLLAI
jgi:hypothetical protein